VTTAAVAPAVRTTTTAIETTTPTTATPTTTTPTTTARTTRTTKRRTTTSRGNASIPPHAVSGGRVLRPGPCSLSSVWIVADGEKNAAIDFAKELTR
jgi:hypothetical protein